MMRIATLTSPQGTRLSLAGGILGLAEDAAQVRSALEAVAYEAVLLGIPFEDLDAIRATHGQERTKEFNRDEMDDLYLETLSRFGQVQVPPGDLYAAFDHAQKGSLRVEAIDLGDEGHTAVWTENVGVFELLRNNRRLRKLDGNAFTAATPEAFAQEWDEKLFPTKGLRRVQQEREAWMAKRITEIAAEARRLFALVPLARWAGVRDRLVATAGWAQSA
jgi:hypothetical protein